MNEKEIKSEFNINIYGDLVPYNDVISKLEHEFFINMLIEMVLIFRMNLQIN